VLTSDKNKEIFPKVQKKTFLYLHVNHFLRFNTFLTTCKNFLSPNLTIYDKHFKLFDNFLQTLIEYTKIFNLENVTVGSKSMLDISRRDIDLVKLIC